MDRDTELTETLALVLRKARRDAGLSQRDLAHWSRVPRATIGRIEAATAAAGFVTVTTLLRTCGYDVELFDRTGRPVELFCPESRRDRAGRRYPAHLDLRVPEKFGDWWGDPWIGAWGVPERPAVTYDLLRSARGTVPSDGADWDGGDGDDSDCDDSGGTGGGGGGGTGGGATANGGTRGDDGG